MKRNILLLLLLISICLFISACTPVETAQSPDNSEDKDKAPVVRSVGYVEKSDGLHVTGKPIDIDIDSYRLRIGGAVSNELSLSFEDVKGYDSTVAQMELNCPGVFTDIGAWTGVPVSVLLKEAGLNSDTSTVKFVSFDGSYSQKLPLDRVMEGDILVTYQFEGKEFSRVHGYPLRISAPGEVGAVWVKWLGTIVIE
jgi:sulfite dehydrogenase (cytochrome) subunit A